MTCANPTCECHGQPITGRTRQEDGSLTPRTTCPVCGEELVSEQKTYQTGTETTMKLSKKDATAVAAIAARIKAVRKEKGLTQVQLAPKIGIRQSHLSAIERGDAGVGARLVRIAAALGCDPKELLP
jgi:DNA-binding XRE family transcriptional regulator